MTSRTSDRHVLCCSLGIQNQLATPSTLATHLHWLLEALRGLLWGPLQALSLAAAQVCRNSPLPICLLPRSPQ